MEGFAFLELPSEIRLHVYTVLLNSSSPVRSNIHSIIPRYDLGVLSTGPPIANQPTIGHLSLPSFDLAISPLHVDRSVQRSPVLVLYPDK